MNNVTNIIQISSSNTSACPRCPEGPTINDADYFEKMVNHIINSHGYKLLHVGTETDDGNGSQLWYSTVAVLGK